VGYYTYYSTFWDAVIMRCMWAGQNTLDNVSGVVQRVHLQLLRPGRLYFPGTHTPEHVELV
jgi:hypothetical protein